MFWPQGKPPSDNPECGFNNELCEWLSNGIHDIKPTKESMYLCTTLRLFILGHRYLPAGSARGLAHHRCACSLVHRGPRSAEVATADEARCLALVADQLQRHHHHQGASRTVLSQSADMFLVCIFNKLGWVFFVSSRELQVCLSAPQQVRVAAEALSPPSPTTVTASRTRRAKNGSMPPLVSTRYHFPSATSNLLETHFSNFAQMLCLESHTGESSGH